MKKVGKRRVGINNILFHQIAILILIVIVILPPASAANDQESDTQNVPEQFVDEDRIFEAAVAN